MATSTLKLSTSRKVAVWQSKRRNSDRMDTLPNTFALEPGTTCPGATAGPLGCLKVCYAQDHQYSSVVALWQHNLSVIESAYATNGVSAVTELLIEAVRHAEDLHAKKGVAMDIFRLHEAGDFFADWYAQAWAQACRDLPHITFWAYTRSFEFAPILSDAPNLKLYLSVDPENEDAAKIVDTTGIAGVAIITRDESYGRATAVTLTGRKAITCPVESAKPRLTREIHKEGRIYQGACAKCRVCIRGTRNVVFRIRKG